MPAIVPISIRALTLCLILTLIGSCAREPTQRTQPSADERISFYAKKISNNPRLYPVYAQLGAAYLDKARETSDPAFISKARSALNRSIEIQSNFHAFKTMAALSNYVHQFRVALQWGKRAAEASPTDTAVTALLVEARLGLGQVDEAGKLLALLEEEPADFHLAAARGRLLVYQKRYDEAVEAFLKAADFAREEGIAKLIVWARVSAAGAFIDSGRPQLARPHLDAAARLDPTSKQLRIHEAEIFQAQKNPQRALAVYQSILRKGQDPAIERRAFLLAAKLGREAEAQGYFEATEKNSQRVIDAGEIYTLGSLAQLYCDAGVKLEQALALAERNLEYKRDRKAQATLDCIVSKLR